MAPEMMVLDVRCRIASVNKPVKLKRKIKWLIMELVGLKRKMSMDA